MQDPYQKPKMSPFQEAMFKFEQALKESMEVEQTRQREQSSRMSQQRPMSSARQPGQRPPQRAVRPDSPGGTSFAQPAAPQRQPMASRIVEPETSSNGDEGDPGYDLSYPNIGDQVTMPTIQAASREATNHIAKQAAAYSDKSKAIDSFQGHSAAANAADAAYQTIVPLTQTASPLMQGIIWAEVLGKPVSIRRGRGRHGL